MPDPAPEPPAPLRRDVGATLELEVTEPTAFALAVAVAVDVPVASETLRIRIDGDEVAPRELADGAGGRLHVFETPPGLLVVDYAATVVGRAAPRRVEPLDEVVFLRPSRYVQSDALTDVARATFAGLDGRELVARVESWVHERLRYDAASTSPTGGALETLETGAGVCRDYAHLVAALLRALDVPARIVSVYAPGLEPRDFHAVVEAAVEGRWIVVDATRLAARSTMVRIATGRDAADTAFETNTLADVRLVRLDVRATAEPSEADDPAEVVELG